MEYTKEDIENAFKFHPPKDESVSRTHEEIRAASCNFALWIYNNTPPCHERDIAIDKLREVMYWANSAIACNQTKRG